MAGIRVATAIGSNERTQPVSFTVAICAFNAVERIGRALDALARLRYGGQWEVLVVDNASTDGTGVFVTQWEKSLPGLRVIREAEAGVAHARMRAIREASLEWIVWVDDDNLLPENYLDTARAIVAGRESIGIVAGDSCLFELAVPPGWFHEVAGCFAVGRQFPREGRQDGGAFSWGAGTLLRRVAALEALQLGFRPLLTGRVGRHQLAGEDAEICLALRLSGWQLHYSRELVIGHAIEPRRMSKEVLRKTAFGFGLASVVLEVYRSYFDPPVKRWFKTHDIAFAVYLSWKFLTRWLRSLLRNDLRARVDVWASQGGITAYFSGLRPSRVLATPFLEGLPHPPANQAASGK